MTPLTPGRRIPKQVAADVRRFLRERGVKAKVAIVNRDFTLEVVIGNRLWWFGRDPYYVSPLKCGGGWTQITPALSRLTEEDLSEMAGF